MKNLRCEDSFSNIEFTIESQIWLSWIKKHREGLCKVLSCGVKSIFSDLNHGKIMILYTDDSSIQKLNAKYRNKNTPTNVLSFPQFESVKEIKTFQQMDCPFLIGDIVLAYNTILQESLASKKDFFYHCAHLLIHGLLHLFGFDHKHDDDALIMELKEQEILLSLGIVDGSYSSLK